MYCLRVISHPFPITLCLLQFRLETVRWYLIWRQASLPLFLIANTGWIWPNSSACWRVICEHLSQSIRWIRILISNLKLFPCSFWLTTYLICTGLMRKRILSLYIVDDWTTWLTRNTADSIVWLVSIFNFCKVLWLNWYFLEELRCVFEFALRWWLVESLLWDIDL